MLEWGIAPFMCLFAVLTNIQVGRARGKKYKCNVHVPTLDISAIKHNNNDYDNANDKVRIRQ